MVTQRTTTPKEPEGLIMFGTEPWGYGGYGQFHMVVWIILAIAVVAGVGWRLALAGATRSGSAGVGSLNRSGDETIPASTGVL